MAYPMEVINSILCVSDILKLDEGIPILQRYFLQPSIPENDERY